MVGMVSAGSGCVGSEPGIFAGDEIGAYTQNAFRVRSDLTAGLNADHGWAGVVNENVTVFADQPFRIRLEVEGPPLSVSRGQRFALQYRRNGSDWMDVEAQDFPKPESSSPRVSIVSSGSYADGTGTTDLLPGSSAPFRAGRGVSLAARTGRWSGASAHGEWEWPLLIRRFADGAVTNEEGDSFEFRMVEADGDPLGSYRTPMITLAVAPGHLGGTFVETPGRIGPWEASNGDLYFIMEPAETSNLFMMVKSSDGGTTWQEVDGANRPSANDLEGVASQLAGHTIHILHQTSRVHYHTFRTSDHPTHPDTWDVRSEPVASTGSPPTQAVALAIRSDGSLVGVYSGASRVHLRIRSPAGSWGQEIDVDPQLGATQSGPQAVLGAGDEVHLAYTAADGTAWYRRLQPNGTLSDRERLATGLGTSSSDRVSVLPLVFIPETNTVVVLYRAATGRLWERRITANGPAGPPVQVSERAVVQDAVDSHQTGADVIADGTTLHLLFIEEGSGSIFHSRSDAVGVWLSATPVVEGIRAEWVRGTLHRRAGAKVYGYVYDAGSGGGGGMNKFATLPVGNR